MTSRVSEAGMASVVRAILKKRPKKSATFAELRKLIPKRIKLSPDDRAASPSRPSEELWEQILRNLRSHHREGFVSVAGGIRLQWQRGRKPAKQPAHAE